jgi:hypothetical protein
MKKYILLIAFLSALLAGCGSAKPGVVNNAGVAQYPLCEKAKTRITDIQRVSFELPLLFKQAPCGNWPGYSHSLRSDSVSVTLPGVIANESTMEIGGVHALSVTAGFEMYADYLTPDLFFDEYKEHLSRRTYISRLVTASWVSWSKGRCARFYSDNDSALYLLRALDYFCWETASGTDFPIHIHATQKQFPGQPASNLDKVLVEPALFSMQVYQVGPERLMRWSNERAKFCKTLRKSYDEQLAVKLIDDLDRRRTIRFLRNCGYEMPDPVGIESWKELFKPNGQLIGHAVSGDETLRRVTSVQFAGLTKNLMSLQPKRGERQEVRVQGVSRDGKGLVDTFRLAGPYDGEWYRFPPYYSERNGIGIRIDPALGQVIDVHIREDVIPLGLRIVSE